MRVEEVEVAKRYVDENVPEMINVLMAANRIGTYVQFAEELGGISPTTVKKWCTGECVPSTYYIAKIASVFNVSADWLLGLNEHVREAIRWG